MVLTLEPGIYVRPADGVPEAVPQHRHPHRRTTPSSRPTGCELISRGVPVKADEIEALMQRLSAPTAGSITQAPPAPGT